MARLFVAVLTVWASLSQLPGQSASYSNPVLPGDHPDPSLTRIAGEFWATSTSSAWAPVFPLLHSQDLVHWTLAGAVFEQAPQWSAGSYWAPEISYFKGRVYVYYTARRRGGPLCVALATAERPAGPYTDHGPLTCEDAGSIDPVTALDEKGDRHLIWKRDGNSRQQPTPIQIQKLSDDGTKLIGTKTELIRNDQPWEGQLVEGPFVLHRSGWFYLFYSAAGCCGVKCDYRVGVARARHLLGPYQKYAKNPILSANERWVCPGHGSVAVDAQGREFFLYHAYDPKNSIFVGRQGLLDRVQWTADGWPSINGGRGPSIQAQLPFPSRLSTQKGGLYEDSFEEKKLRPEWQWPWDQPPAVSFGHRSGGLLELAPRGSRASDRLGAVLAVEPLAGDYQATVELDPQSLGESDWAGLTAYGDENNALGIAVHQKSITVWRRRSGKDATTATTPSPAASAIHLRMQVSGGDQYTFAYSADGTRWTALNERLSGDYLPPWDLATRIAISAGGSKSTQARFASFRVVYGDAPPLVPTTRVR
jgi:xylan 1,4-beta-xylosidase